MSSGFLGGQEDNSISFAGPIFSTGPATPRQLPLPTQHIPQTFITTATTPTASLLNTIPDYDPPTRPCLPPRPAATLPRPPVKYPTPATNDTTTYPTVIAPDQNLTKYRQSLINKAKTRVTNFLGKYMFGKEGNIIDILPPIQITHACQRDMGYLQGEIAGHPVDVN